MSSFEKGQISLLKFHYDFARDGGATAALIPLRPQLNALSDELTVLDAYLVVEEGLTSGGTPTVTLGNTADPDGYLENFWALRATGTVVRAGDVDGDLIYDDEDGKLLAYKLGAVDTLDLVLDVGVAALTAGKFTVYLKVIAG